MSSRKHSHLMHGALYCHLPFRDPGNTEVRLKWRRIVTNTFLGKQPNVCVFMTQYKFRIIQTTIKLYKLANQYKVCISISCLENTQTSNISNCMYLIVQVLPKSRNH